MRQSTTHGQFTRCSICGQAGRPLVARISQFGWTAGWHRTSRLCAQCNRLLGEILDAMREEARS